jgi:hypothetical protein
VGVEDPQSASPVHFLRTFASRMDSQSCPAMTQSWAVVLWHGLPPGSESTTVSTPHSSHYPWNVLFSEDPSVTINVRPNYKVHLEYIYFMNFFLIY